MTIDEMIQMIYSEFNGFIEIIEDPITSNNIPIEKFAEIYAPIFRSIRNKEYEDEKLSYYFHCNILNCSSLIFLNNEERENFFDWAQDLKCIPTLKEIKEGEDNDEYEKRKNNEISQQIQKEKKEKQKNIVLSEEEQCKKDEKKINNLRKRMNKMNKDSKKYLKIKGNIGNMIDMYEIKYNKEYINN